MSIIKEAANTAGAAGTVGSAATNVGRRVLFFAEAATLAHVARPMVLAQTLEAAGYEVHFACDGRYRELFPTLARPWYPLESIDSQAFLDALANGRPLYSTERLQQYVEADLVLIEAINPNLIVGDFRLSLSISARLAGIHYMAITNAYWSPYARPQYRVPELSITRALGVPLANLLFKLARPLAFALHTRPLNLVRKHYGLPSLGLDLRRTYTDADTVLYADLPELIPTFDRPISHQYIGPINWSPDIPLPPWWDKLPEDRPVVYVTLGSSGQSNLLPTILSALAKLPISVIAATVGRITHNEWPANVFVTDYLPGDQAAARAKLVICNGGSPTTLQALSEGVPVIGIASNLDQYLNMGYLEKAGVGRLVRSGQVSTVCIKQETERILGDLECQGRTVQVQNQVTACSATSNMLKLVNTIIPACHD